jgi:hypothetical protein
MDAFCLCLLALVVMLSLRASKAASAQTCLAVGPLLLLAVAAKYVGLLFVPTVLALLARWSWKHKGLEEMFVRLGIALFSLVVSGFIAFLNLDKQVLTGLSSTTTNRVSSGAMPILVMQHIAVMEGIFFGLAFLLIAKIPIHNSYGYGYFWVWSTHAYATRTNPMLVNGRFRLHDLYPAVNNNLDRRVVITWQNVNSGYKGTLL